MSEPKWWHQGTGRLLAVTVGLSVAFFAGMSTILEPSIPQSSAVPALPDGLRVVRELEACGSGSCYRELTITGPPGMAPDQIAQALNLSQESCHNNGLLDFKQRCVGVDRVGDEVRLYVSVSEFW